MAVIKSLNKESLGYTWNQPIMFACPYMNNIYHYIILSISSGFCMFLYNYIIIYQKKVVLTETGQLNSGDVVNCF